MQLRRSRGAPLTHNVPSRGLRLFRGEDVRPGNVADVTEGEALVRGGGLEETLEEAHADAVRPRRCQRANDEVRADGDEVEALLLGHPPCLSLREDLAQVVGLLVPKAGGFIPVLLGVEVAALRRRGILTVHRCYRRREHDTLDAFFVLNNTLKHIYGSLDCRINEIFLRIWAVKEPKRRGCMVDNVAGADNLVKVSFRQKICFMEKQSPWEGL
mmetsp:Transcript_23300/g.55768  ORF Transcript_23300/g.55768 Transcript_23300/m.55768 type:complete len:214 (-) Transcript_23300:321-962(-)